MPWRKTDDPYQIWISEIMLQQTQVQQVIPYFIKFIAAFPTVQDLAAARLSQVLKVWEGMGYYTRARNLHRSAQLIVTEHRGAFPAEISKVRKLPGIGPYTAAAILSIAFHQDHAVLDGNVIRVLSRMFKIQKSPKSTLGKKVFRELAEALLMSGQAGTYNQALMELGAVVCTPMNPDCRVCPVSGLCSAKKAGEQLLYPVKTLKKKRPHYLVVAGIIWKDDQILIARRPEEGLLGGLWEFPGGKVEEGESFEVAVAREVKEEIGISVSVTRLLATIRHQYTHFGITLHAFECRYIAGEPQTLGCTEWRWVKREELSDYAFPRANGKIFDKIFTPKTTEENKPQA